jgi:hypothetical protein
MITLAVIALVSFGFIANAIGNRPIRTRRNHERD